MRQRQLACTGVVLVAGTVIAMMALLLHAYGRELTIAVLLVLLVGLLCAAIAA